jgi:glycosyltransferase involved in cell wall biosynthesis
VTVTFDLLGLQSRDNNDRGIARYVLNLALALERTNPGLITHYLVHPDLPLPDRAEPLLATGRAVRTDEDDHRLRPSNGGVFLAGSPFEYLHEPMEHVLPHWCRSPQWRRMAVIYDLIPALFSDHYLTQPGLAASYRARTQALASCDRLLAISQATADDAVELLGVSPQRLTVIFAGADNRFRLPADSPSTVARRLAESGEVPGLRSRYLLFPTGIEWRKNVDRTLEAYGSLPTEVRARHQLVLVAKLDDDSGRIVEELVERYEIAHDVLATGFVPDDTLTRLYQGAGAVVFPSLYEGFGLPALEAMQCGAAVICADSSSLTEVQTLPEARFDPESVPSIAAAMERVLCDHDFRQHLQAQPIPPFTWDRAAELTAEAIGHERAAVPPARSRPRLALFTPLPPQRSGIATYAYRLLEHLTAHCDVTVFVDDELHGQGGGVIAPDGVSVEPIRRFETIAGGGRAFDRLLYFMGNSEYHVEMLDLLKRRRGAVMFHDVRLTGLYSHVCRLAPERLHGHSVGATLAHLYPHRYPPAMADELDIPVETAERFGILLAREVAGLAEQSLVHSSHATTLLRLDAGVAAEAIYPHPCPVENATDPTTAEATAEADVEAGGATGATALVGPEGPPTIATFGMLQPQKNPGLVIRALASIRATVPDAVLELVGGIEPDYRDELIEIADAAGVTDSVHFRGHLDPESFRAAQKRATVAVQIRTSSNGESSGAVSELLALGVPTVVTELGAMAELPRGVVATVEVGADASQLADTITSLLLDAEARQQLSTAATEYARANGYERAAETLAKILFY